MTSLKKRLSVILSRPQKPDNIGLAARALKNTGFENLRVVGMDSFERKSYVTAVHSQEILDTAQFYPTLQEATADQNIVLASTSKRRKNFPLLSLDEAVSKVYAFPETTQIGLLFGNEITGLTSEELSLANFHFTIPQFGDQPSYNLASAVLVSLFSLFTHYPGTSDISEKMSLPWKEQEACMQMILQKLEDKNFIHPDNKQHVTERVFDLFGRLAMTDKDRKLLLAIFSKGPDSI
ncbi:RNA methyltransferase [Acidobacteriota bacterium]